MILAARAESQKVQEQGTGCDFGNGQLSSFQSCSHSLSFSAAFRGCTLNFYHLYLISWCFPLYKWFKHYVQAMILAARAKSQKVQDQGTGYDFGSQSRITEGTRTRYRLRFWR